MKMDIDFVISAMKYKPGPPEGLNPDRMTKSSVALSWRPPKDDGGSKIVGNIVEMKHKDDNDFRDLGSGKTVKLTRIEYGLGRVSLNLTAFATALRKKFL